MQGIPSRAWPGLAMALFLIAANTPGASAQVGGFGGGLGRGSMIVNPAMLLGVPAPTKKAAIIRTAIISGLIGVTLPNPDNTDTRFSEFKFIDVEGAPVKAIDSASTDALRVVRKNGTISIRPVDPVKNETDKTVMKELPPNRQLTSNRPF